METSARDFALIGMNHAAQRCLGKTADSKFEVGRTTDEAITISNPELRIAVVVIRKPAGFGAEGYLDTKPLVFPEQEVVIVRMQANPVEDATSYGREALPIFAK